jgi:hypothetical protein
MKKVALVVLLLCSALAWAGSEPNPADYTINVHVSSSLLDISYSGGGNERAKQRLKTTIDGKKYELRSVHSSDTVLAPGDYKAKLIRDEHKTSYDSSRLYEFLFPDHKTRTFEVVGMTE